MIALILAVAIGTSTLELSLSADTASRQGQELRWSASVRADRVIVGGTARVRWQPGRAPSPVTLRIAGQALERGPRPDEFVIPGGLATQGSAVVLSGASEGVARVELEVDTTPLPLPNDLSILPLPFVDRQVDERATIDVVVADVADTDSVRAAALVAGWFGTQASTRLHFRVHENRIPDEGSAIVIVDAAGAAAFGLDPLEGPAVRLVGRAGGAGQLLVIGGRTKDEVLAAAAGLAQGTRTLAGAELRYEPGRPNTGPAYPPRWRPPGDVDLTAVGGALVVEDPETLRRGFRIASDLFFWPRETIPLDLAWSLELEGGATPPRIDVVFNGRFVASLEPSRAGPGRRRLAVRTEHLRGFNELRLHATGPGPGTGTARLTLTSGSILRVGDAVHYAELPDVSRALHDGYPFTEHGGLAGTTLLVSPRAEALGTALSVVAHFAAVTGAPPLGLEVRSSAAPGTPTTDVLAVLTPDDGLLASLRPRLPFDEAFAPKRPDVASLLADALGGLRRARDLTRARAEPSPRGARAFVAGAVSPWTSGKELVVITAETTDAMPAMERLVGYAESRTPSGDLLVAAGGRRWMYALGDTHPRGVLGGWTAARRGLARRWVALWPGLGVGVLLLSAVVQQGLGRRARARLAAGGDA